MGRRGRGVLSASLESARFRAEIWPRRPPRLFSRVRMPKLSHEMLVLLVKNGAEGIVGIICPESQVTRVVVTAAEFADLNLAEYRADAVLAIEEEGRTVEAFVVEAQSEKDPRKREVWPLYVAGLRARLGCPVTLVVLTIEREVARWAAESIDCGRSRLIQRPLVIGPEDVPVITDVEQARRAPELAVLSVMVHAEEANAEDIGRAAVDAVRDLDRQRDKIYADVIAAVLARVDGALLERVMGVSDYEYQSDVARQWFGDGMAKGKAETLLKLLQLKGFNLTEGQRERVLKCTDEAEVERWIERVLFARSLDEVFAD